MEDFSSIVDAIDRLSVKLGTLPALQGGISFNDFASAAFVVIIGAFSAYCFNFYHWKTVKKNTNITNLSKELSVIIKQLEEEAVAYWVKDYDDKLSHEFLAAEVSIKSKIRVINSIIDTFTRNLSEENHRSQVERLRDFRKELFDLVTGDDFEARRRKASKTKAIKISNRCSNIRTTIAQLDLSL